MTSAIAYWLAGEVFDISLGEAFGRLLQRRAAVARDILQEELARADIGVADAADRDEAAAMVFEYTEASRQGAARRNLRMLAQVLAGSLATPPIYASEFLRWSRILSDLTAEEIIYLARLHQAYQMPEFDRSDGKKEYSALSKYLQARLISEGVARDGAEVSGILGALQRTGLVFYSAGGFGGAWHKPTRRLSDLLQLIRIEEVISEPLR